MARQRPPDRLNEIARAATRVFIERGYRRTRMTDVAAVLGLTSGALYGYVEGKEALFHLAISYALDTPDIESMALPVPTPLPGETLALVDKWMAKDGGFPMLAAAVRRRAPSHFREELAQIIDERYAYISDNRRLLALLEQCALDQPQLFELYYRHRRSQIEQLTRYVRRRTSEGKLRPTPDPATTTRFMIEAIAWFAWHRKADPDSAMIDDRAARATVLDMTTASLLPHSGVDDAH